MEKIHPLRLVELLKGHKVYLQTHNFPDPDAMASAFGLQYFLKMHGVETTICYDGRIDKLSAKRMVENFGMEISQSTTLCEMKETDYIVTIDGQKYNSNFTDLCGMEVACIDHHPVVHECEYTYRDIRMVGACASIIASYFEQTNTPMDQEVASALAYGIKMDTADFTRGATGFDVEMFAYVYQKADIESLNRMYKNVMEYSDLKAYAAAIDNIRLYDKTGFAMIPFDCPDALIAIISDFILSLDVVDVSVIYSIRSNGIKFSVRSEEPKVDAGKLVANALKGLGNGGGHKSMAGGFIPKESSFFMEKDLESTIERLFVEELRKLY